MAPIPKPVRPAALRNALYAPLSVVPSTAPPTFPIAALGPLLSCAITAVAARTQAPTPLVAHHMLTLAAAAAQRHIRVRLPTGAQRPVSCYFATVAENDAANVAVMHLAATCARQWGQGPDKVPEPEYFRFITREYDENDRPIEGTEYEFSPPILLPPEPPPRGQRSKPPVRALPRALFADHPSDVVPRGTHRRMQAARLCRLWDGAEGGAPGEISTDGGDQGPVSLHLVAAAREARGFLGDPDLAAGGLLARILAVAPAVDLGARTWASAPDDAPPPEFDALKTVIEQLSAAPAPAEKRTVPFSAPAQAAYLAFAHEMERALAPGGAYEAVRPLAGRLAEHAARLAAVLAFIDDKDLAELSEANLESGIALARFYAEEALRLLNLAAPVLSPEEQEDLLREWLHRARADDVVTLRDLCRTGPKQLRGADNLYKLMRCMEREGLVQSTSGSLRDVDAPRRPRATYAWRIGTEEQHVA